MTQFTEQYPPKLAHIPEAWWDSLLDGYLYALDLSTFHVPTNVVQFRAACYRQALNRGLRVTVSVPRQQRHLLLIHAYETVAPMTMALVDAQAAPEMPKIKVPVPGAAFVSEGYLQRRATEQAAAVEAAKAAKEAERLAAAKAREDAVMTSVAATFHEEFNKLQDARQEQWAREAAARRAAQAAAAQAAEDAQIRSLCSCGTEDVRFHDPSCLAWGG